MPKRRYQGGRRSAIYSRYSPGGGRNVSLEQQQRNCRGLADIRGLEIIPELVAGDAAKRGRSFGDREGLQSLLKTAQLDPCPFDVLIVDELSRLGRDETKVKKMIRAFKKLGIRVLTVMYNLDSEDPTFDINLSLISMMDEQNAAYMRHRVRRGHEDAALKGFSTGGRCFGYRSKSEPNPAYAVHENRAHMLGVKWYVYQPEALIVIRIFEEFADGSSISDICLRLNDEKVPGSGKTRVDDIRPVWNPTLIKNILKREKYRGRYIYGVTTQSFDVDEERVLTEKTDAATWLETEKGEHLRIVSDELWDRVQARLRVVNEKMTARRIAGMNRARKREYLFSGLLVCGVCGDRINIQSSHAKGRNASYGCRAARYNRRGCTNHTWIREDRLSDQLIAALTERLLVPDVMSYYADSVRVDLDKYLKAQSRTRGDKLLNLRSEAAKLRSEIDRLYVMSIEHGAKLISLPEQIKQREDRLKEIEADLAVADLPEDAAGTKLDLDALVKRSALRLSSVLKQDVVKARQVLQQYVKSIRLTPIETDQGPGYHVICEANLFEEPSTGKGRVLVARSSTGTVHQYTGAVDFNIAFAGELVYSNRDLGPNPLMNPMTKILTENPDLLHTPQIAKRWTELLAQFFPEGSPLHDYFHRNYVLWNLRTYEQDWIDRFKMNPIRYRRETYYMFSGTGQLENTTDSEQPLRAAA